MNTNPFEFIPWRITTVRTILLSALAILTTATGALACSPAPSCWMKSGLADAGAKKEAQEREQISVAQLDHSSLRRHVC